MSKCNNCGQEMVWKGSMMDGGLSCDCLGSRVSKKGGPAIGVIYTTPITTNPYEDEVAKEYIENRLPQTKMVEVVTKKDKWTTYKYYTLIGQAVDDHDDFEVRFDHGCQCATSHAPCSWCTHPGNPNGFDNRADVREHHSVINFYTNIVDCGVKSCDD